MYAKITLILTLFVTAFGCQRKDTPENVVEDYLSTDNWKERLEYVDDKENVSPLMEKFYGNRELSSDDIEEIMRVDKKSEIKLGEWAKVEVKHNSSDNSIYYVKNTPQGYKIDWSASLGLIYISWKEYFVQSPIESTKLRFLASFSLEKSLLVNYFPGEYWTLKLRVPTMPDVNLITGIVSKETHDGQKIYELLKEYEEHRILVKANLVQGSGSFQNFLIQDLISTEWVEEEFD